MKILIRLYMKVILNNFNFLKKLPKKKFIGIEENDRQKILKDMRIIEILTNILYYPF